jgi:dTDP-4-amino-4,6-dideoxygalactose transaminase
MSQQRLAIDGGDPVRTAPFPAWPVYDEGDERAVLAVLHSGLWGVADDYQGQVATFARRFADFQQARFGVCVANGTLALELALRALGVGPGDEVITTPYTFIATASAILTVGARPVFVDIDPASYNLDPAQIEAALSGHTRLIVPVHVAGQPVDLDALLDVAARHGLGVLEDACHAWGAEWKGRRVGAIGDLGVFSFQASKNLTAGEGGIVLTNDERLAEVCWSLHNVGRTRQGARYFHAILGSNLRMTEWQGAILLSQLDRLPAQMAAREGNARYLSGALRGQPGIIVLPDDPRVTSHGRHLYVFRYQAAAFGGRSRDDFVTALQAEGIPAQSGYVPLYTSPAIAGTMKRMFGTSELPVCPIAEQLCRETVWLPQNAFLGAQHDMDTIVEAIAKISEAWQ